MAGHDPIVLAPGEGERCGAILTFKATADDGQGRFSFIEEALEPGAGGPPLHTHNTHDEAFYVVSGTLTMRAGENTVEAPAGAFVFVPAGTVHGFANRSHAPVKFVFIHAPGGFEQYFREAAAAFNSKSGTRVALRDLALKYGSTHVGPPLGGT